MARKKNKHQLRNYGIVVSIILVFSIVGLTSLPIPGVDALDEKTVELPPLSFTEPSSSDNPIGTVYAKVKQTTYAIDSTGKILLSDQSTGIEGNPLLAFLDPSSGRDIAGFIVIPKIWLDFPTTYKPNIIIDSTTLYLQVQSQDPTGAWKHTVSKSIQTYNNILFKPGDPEIALASFGVQWKEIYDKIVNDDYNSIQRFSVNGDIIMHYENAPSVIMTIPIGLNDLKSYYTARVTSDAPSNDDDGDGILNQYDKCPTTWENFNGFEDTDGCPDTPPATAPPSTTTSTTTTPVVTDEEKCVADGNQWINGVCVEDTTTSGPGTTVTTTLNSTPFAVIAVKTNYLDGSSSHKAFTSSDGTFDFILNSLIVDGNGRDKSVGSINYNAYLGTFGSDLKGFKVATSDLKFKGTVDIASKELDAGTKNGVGGTTSEAQALTLLNDGTSIKFNGLSVAQVTFTSVDIHNAVNSYQGVELVPEGSERSLSFIVDIAGSVVLTSASGTVPLTLTGATTTFDGMSLLNQVVPKGTATTYTSFAQASLACGGDDKVKSIGGGEYSCIPGSGPTTGGLTCPDTEYVVVVDGTETCIKKGTTKPGPTPLPGGTNEICTDANNPGGFTCTSDYRNIWCNGTTSCEVPPTVSTPNCNDTNSCTPIPKGPVCTPPAGFQPNSIADNVCVNGSPDGPGSGDPGKVCTSITECVKDQFNIDLNDPLTIGIIAIGAVVLLVSVTKRDSRYSPIPASPTQFSR